MQDQVFIPPAAVFMKGQGFHGFFSCESAMDLKDTKTFSAIMAER